MHAYVHFKMTLAAEKGGGGRKEVEWKRRRWRGGGHAALHGRVRENEKMGGSITHPDRRRGG